MLRNLGKYFIIIHNICILVPNIYIFCENNVPLKKEDIFFRKIEEILDMAIKINVIA